jgi:HlyD family secretion protein
MDYPTRDLRRRLRPRLARVLLSAVLAPALIAGCATAPSGQPPTAPVPVQTSTVAPMTINGTVVYSGNVQSLNQVNVLPKIAGQITKLNVGVGSVVKQGDVIAELDHAALDAQVAQAQAGLAAAQAHLATIQVGPRPENVAQAQANLQAAQAQLTFMQNGGRQQNVTAAQANLDAAVAKLNSLEAGRPETIAQAQANLQAAQAKLQALKNGPTADQVKAAELAYEQAKNAAYAANTQKDAACNPLYGAVSCNAAQAAAAAAATGAQQAATQLKVLTDPPTAQALQEAQAGVDTAQAQLQEAQHPGSSTDIAAAQSAVDAAQAQLDLAKQQFTSADLAKAQAAVDVAQQQLLLAQHPYTAQDTAAAQAAVQQAQAALQSATVARNDAIVTAPFDGIIAQKLLSVGAMAAPTTPIVVLVDPAVETVVQVDSTNAASLQNGQTATITASALPGKSIAGKITSIAPTVDPSTRTVQVKVVPVAADSGLKPGMLAQVALITATHHNALVVPAGAVVQRNGQPTVYVVANGVAAPQVVQTGLTDGTHVEIVSGLHAGQVVVVSGQDQLTATQPVTVQH